MTTEEIPTLPLNLNDAYSILGAGTSRKAIQLSDDWIAKIPLNHVGNLQNRVEAKIYPQSAEFPFVRTCHYVEDRNVLIMKKVTPLPKIKTLISEYLEEFYPHIKFPDRNLIRKFVEKFNLHVDDIFTPDAWGIADAQIFLFDYGCTSDIFINYYNEF